MSALQAVLGMTARNHRGAGQPKIDLIGVCSTVSGTAPWTLSLPTECVEGDTCVAAINMSRAYASNVPTGWNTVLALTPVDGSSSADSAANCAGLFARDLSAADIMSGEIPVAFDAPPGPGNGFGYCMGAVWRGLDGDPLDVQGWQQHASTGFGPFTLTADAIAPNADDGITLFFAAISTSGTNTKVFNGFTGGFEQLVSNLGTYDDMVLAQGPHGTSPVSCVYDTPVAIRGYGAGLGSLRRKRPPVPKITVTADLPDKATVGTAYTGTVTVTLVAAAGPVTITLVGIPSAWIGTTVDNGDGTYAVAVKGTPDAAQTINWTADAKNGTLDAAQIAGSIVVKEPGSLLRIQMASTFRQTALGQPIVATLADVQKGDLIVVVLQYGSAQPTWVFNADDSATNTYAPLMVVHGGGGATDIYSWATTAASDTKNLDVLVSVTGHNIAGLVDVYQFRGGKVEAGDCVGMALTAIRPAGTKLTCPAFAVVDGGIVIAAASVYISAGAPSFDPITPSVGSYHGDVDGTYSASVQFHCGDVTDTGAQSGMDITWTPNPTDKQWRGSCVVIPVNPS